MEEQNKHYKTCVKCKEDFIWDEKDAHWDYKGYTDTKIVTCSFCGCVQAIKYKEQINPNYDRRYFD